tara:strand:+ start:21438 stop:22295 length:858 start_codon:yes stop_codon:yes gene_type:complete
MKKRVLLVASIFAATFTFAQDGAELTSKKGETILPEAGDYAIGFNAAPFLNYAGNLFSSAGNTAPTANFATPDFSIIGKYFVDAQTAYRGRVRIGFGSSTNKVLTDTSLIANGGVGRPEDQGSYIEDVYKSSYKQITLGAGLEKRKGNTRIQGYYGGEFLISFGGSSAKNTYGLEMNDNTTQYSNVGTSRTLSVTGGNMFGLGLRGFIGAEIFVFPKLSISAEYGWGLMMSTTGETVTKTENWQLASSTATSPSLVETETKTGGSSAFGIDTDNNGGQLNIIFHF